MPYNFWTVNEGGQRYVCANDRDIPNSFTKRPITKRSAKRLVYELFPWVMEEDDVQKPSDTE